MKRFKILNNLVGWVIFAIAAVTYLLTIEPTASFWDCGEFISTADKLEVGHPPGAPFFMLTAKFFTLFASDQTQVAMMVNSFSAICSALCILFLFWTITHLTRKMVVSDESNIDIKQIVTILGAGAVGALAYTFSDTFWFSAVEGEVYAYSSLFTAVVFWAILKWEDVADQPYANRWLILIAYLMGLSVGVHLLNLLTIPALVLVYYFKKYKNPSTKGIIYSLLLSCVILVFILYGVIPGFVQVAGWFELFFVNTLHFSFNTGTVVYAVLLIACLAWGIKETMIDESSDPFAIFVESSNRRMIVVFLVLILLLGIPFLGGRISPILGLILTIAVGGVLFKYAGKISAPLLNTIILCCTVILLGYSTYATVIIRSTANTPMDQNSPDDVFALKGYLNREQYGDTPLLYGESYASELKRKKTSLGWEVDVKEGEALYAKKIKTSEDEADSYVQYDTKKKYKYDLCMLFPRMYSKQPQHVDAYKSWANIKGKKVRYRSMNEDKLAIVPTFADNITFFIRYQVNFMYWRYFLWNFAGRQNDIQGHGGPLHGNWITGINLIDSIILGGDQSKMPDELKNNKGHNVYYCLPLLLGLLGIWSQLRRKQKGFQGFLVTFVLFFMTGLAIVLYLNQTPYQPRERDYAYAGSFYAFCIWIGLGVVAVSDIISLLTDKYGKVIAPIVSTALCLLVPIQMAAQNWDDHDRSKRYTCRDFGQNYLLTLEPNAVIFTNGDNDTFPLWYNQEVEGVGTDARVANLSYLQMGWYVDQMKHQAYESDPLPLSLEPKDYMNGNLDVVYLASMLPEINLNLAIDIAKNPEKYKQYNPYRDESISFMPSKSFVLDVNKEDVLNSGIISSKDSVFLPDQIRLNLPSSKNYLGKHEIMILDLLQNNKWKRPIYFAVTVGSDSYMGLNRYLSLEGMAYRVMPKPKGVLSKNEYVNIDRTYENLLHKFKWGGIAENPNIYMDENNLRMTSTLRFMFVRLADALLAENRRDEVESQYCEVLKWVLYNGQNAMKDRQPMNTYRTLSRIYYDNDRVSQQSAYSDSMLIALAPSIVSEVIGCSKSLSKDDMIHRLDNYISSIRKEDQKLAAEKRNAKVVEALDFCAKVLPTPQIPYTSANLIMARLYIEAGHPEKAAPIVKQMKETALQYLSWIAQMNPRARKAVADEFSEKFSFFAEIVQIEQNSGASEEDLAKDMVLYNKYMDIYKNINR